MKEKISGAYVVYKVLKAMWVRVAGTPAEAFVETFEASCTEDILEISFSNDEHRVLFEKYVQTDFEKVLENVYENSFRLKIVDKNKDDIPPNAKEGK